MSNKGEAPTMVEGNGMKERGNKPKWPKNIVEFMKDMYNDKTWTKEHFNFSLEQKPYTKESKGLKKK